MALAAGGCELTTDCTLVGCGPAILVHVEGVAAGSDMYAALELDDGEVLGLYCPTERECSSDQRLDDHRPAHFRVHLTVNDTTHVREFTPVYRTSHPNGEACGPRCRQAEVTFTVE